MTDSTDSTDIPETNAYIPIPEWLKGEVAQYDLDLMEPPATILDIGANVGAFTLRCKNRWPEAQIHAYEPIKENAAQYRFNCASLPGVQFHEAAVRRFAGQDLILLAGNKANCGFFNLGRQNERGYYVQCVSSATLPSADLVKIDTEGCEVEILERLNLDGTSVVICEWHRTEDRDSIKELCVGKGFRVVSEKVASESGDNGIIKFARAGKVKDRKVKLFIGLPIYSQAMTQFVQCMFALQKNKPFDMELYMCQGDGVARSRNQLTAAFMESDCTHLLFIDSDLIFSPDHVKLITSHDVDVVGGFYPKKQQGDLEWVINTMQNPTLAREDFLHQVAYAGTGFLCIRRAVFERMEKAREHIAFCADYGNRKVQHDFWPMGVYCYECKGQSTSSCTHKVTSRRYLSEDWYFCQNWMDLGGEIYMDTRIILKHIGLAIFPLDTQLDQITNPKNARAAQEIEQTTVANEQV